VVFVFHFSSNYSLLMDDNESGASNNAQQPYGGESEPNCKTSPAGPQGNAPENNALEKEQAETYKVKDPSLARITRDRLVGWWGDPYRPKTNVVEKMTVLLTLVIAAVSILQWRIYRQQTRIMESAGPQTEQLIKSAKINAGAAKQIADASERNATAAEGFATSAGHIKDGIDHAVDKLAAAAAASQQSAGAAHEAVSIARDAMYLEQRPWVGIGIAKASLPANAIVTEQGIQASTVVFVAHNTGRTPAIRFRMQCCESTDQDPAYPVPDYDALYADIDKHFSDNLRRIIREHPEQGPGAKQWFAERRTEEEADAARNEQAVIEPNGTRTLSSLTRTFADDHLFHYTLGEFLYWDVLEPQNMHLTKFCIVQLGSGPPGLCSAGQGMN
jgi:ElaB/YqjD/DUF883 family membrane-anchored ribosome-binding protein